MKTSKQLRQEFIDEYLDYIPSGMRDEFKSELAAYKTALCREQREICAINLKIEPEVSINDIIESIVNAPQPE